MQYKKFWENFVIGKNFKVENMIKKSFEDKMLYVLGIKLLS